MRDEFKRKFLLWFQTQLKRHEINSDGYFYADIMNYGRKVLFVSPVGLRGFCDREVLSISEISEYLARSGIAQNDNYSYHDERGKEVALLAINVDRNIDQELPIKGRILRKQS